MTTRLVLVDDNVHFLAAAQDLLEREGLDVVAVTSTGDDAARLVGELRPDGRAARTAWDRGSPQFRSWAATRGSPGSALRVPVEHRRDPARRQVGLRDEAESRAVRDQLRELGFCVRGDQQDTDAVFAAQPVGDVEAAFGPEVDVNEHS